MPRAVRIEKKCENCGATFLIKPSHAHQRFCGRPCQRAHEAIHGRPAAFAEVTSFTCRVCEKEFYYKPAYLTEYRKKYGKDPMYCSIKCSAEGRRKDTEERSVFICHQCGKTNKMKRYEGATRSTYYRQQKFCNNACKSEWQRQQALGRFNDGDIKRHVKKHGYVWLSVPSLVTGVKHEVLEHRYVMTQHLGRELLPGETVHHIDGDRQNNVIANLKLFATNHGPGQAVEDIVDWCITMLQQYSEFARAKGFELHRINALEHP